MDIARQKSCKSSLAVMHTLISFLVYTDCLIEVYRGSLESSDVTYMLPRHCLGEKSKVNRGSETCPAFFSSPSMSIHDILTLLSTVTRYSEQYPHVFRVKQSSPWFSPVSVLGYG